MSREELEPVAPHLLDRVHGGLHQGIWRAMQKADELGLQIRGLHTGSHYATSNHWRGAAVDIAGSPADMQRFFDWARTTNPRELIHKNQFLRYGRRVRPIGGHDHHVHYAP